MKSKKRYIIDKEISKEIEESKKYPNAILDLIESITGELFLSIPIKMIKCDEKTLINLIEQIYEEIWSKSSEYSMYKNICHKGKPYFSIRQLSKSNIPNLFISPTILEFDKDIKRKIIQTINKK